MDETTPPAGEDVERVARVLEAAWAKAEPNHPVTLYPASYRATFVDLARAALSARPVEAQEVEVAHRAVAMLAVKMQAERDAALARAEALLAGIALMWDERTSQGLPFLAVDEDVPRLRALLDGDSEGRESGQAVAQEGEEEWGVRHPDGEVERYDTRGTAEGVRRRWTPDATLVRRTVTPWVPVETGGEGRES